MTIKDDQDYKILSNHSNQTNKQTNQMPIFDVYLNETMLMLLQMYPW
jgi:hypothetical protein